MRSDIIKKVIYPDVVIAMEDNLIAFIMYCSCIPGAQAYKDKDHIAALTGIPQPSLNVVMRVRTDTENVVRRIAEIMAPFKARPIPMLWWIFPGTQPPNLGMYLSQSGLQHQDVEPGMAMELSKLPTAPTAPNNLSIEEVESDDALQEWIQVSASAFGGSDTKVDPDYIHFEQCLGWGKKRPYRRFLGRLNGKAVATSSIFLGAGVVGLYSVSTLPEVRHQGIGSAISMAPLFVARNLGYNIGVLQASPPGYSVYANIGFRECCRIHTYTWVQQ